MEALATAARLGDRGNDPPRAASERENTCCGAYSGLDATPRRREAELWSTTGLFAIFRKLHFDSVPAMGYSGSTPEPFELPTEFWLAWGGIVSTWSIGRSAERRGARNKAVSLVTGNKLID